MNNPLHEYILETIATRNELRKKGEKDLEISMMYEARAFLQEVEEGTYGQSS